MNRICSAKASFANPGRWGALVCSVVVACAAIFACGVARAQDKVVNVYNWSDYIEPKVLDEFTAQTGIRVVYDTYDSNEVLETKLLAGQTGYDIVVPSATFLQRQIQAGVFQKLDKAKLPNTKNLWPEVMARLAAYDPGNQYAVNYMWSTTGIAYNVAQMRQRMGEKPVDSWDMIFKPENLRRFADCGVYVLDSPEDMFTAAFRFLGLNPDTKRPEDIRRAADTLARIKPFVKKFHSSEYINALANGDICLAVGYSGDSFQARDRAREAKNDIAITYVIPREGALMALDSMAIPKDAPHPDAAYALMNMLMTPEVAARNTARTNFANGVLASKPFLPPEILDNPAIYPPETVMSRLFTVSPNDQATQRLFTRE